MDESCAMRPKIAADSQTFGRRLGPVPSWHWGDAFLPLLRSKQQEVRSPFAESRP
jgi:hypothetical protein